MHFKYLSDFHRRAEFESIRGQMWNDGSEYKKYAEVLQSDSSLSMFYCGSIMYGDSYSLCRYNLLQNVVLPGIQRVEFNGIGAMKVMIIMDGSVTNSAIQGLNITSQNTAGCNFALFDDNEKIMIGELMDIAEAKNITWRARSYLVCDIQQNEDIYRICEQLSLLGIQVIKLLCYSWADRKGIVDLYLNINRLEGVMQGAFALQNSIGEFVRSVSCYGAEPGLAQADRIDYLIAAANEDMARESQKTKALIEELTLSFESSSFSLKYW